MKRVSDDVMVFAAKYGGLSWGEHGKDFRVEYSPTLFDEELFVEPCKVKAAFGPHNRLNSGKACPSEGLDASMIKADAVRRNTFDRQISTMVHQQWRGAVECNGSDLCFNFDARSPTHPSVKITQNRIRSPKGRATPVCEWLRLLADRGINPLKLKQGLLEFGVSLRTLIARTRNSWCVNKDEYNFLRGVKEAMSGCLACRAYSTQCPIKVGVPEFRSRFLQLYHTHYLHPLHDHLVATVESYAPLMAHAPKTFNFFVSRSLVRGLSEKHIGMADLSLLSVPSLQQQVVGHRSTSITLEQPEALNTEQKVYTVLVVQDPLASYYDAQMVADFVRLIEKSGFQPALPPFSPNGKAQHIKGLLNHFVKTVKKMASFPNHVVKLGTPMVGVDPALVLCYRDEYKLTLDEECGESNVLLVNEWLTGVPDLQPAATVSGGSWYFFGHCTKVVALPDAPAQWAAILAHFDVKSKNVSVGCYGMTGTCGYEAENHKNSLGIYELSWHQAMQRLPRNRCLATGYSCRSQVEQVEGTGVCHPVQALLEIIR